MRCHTVNTPIGLPMAIANGDRKTAKISTHYLNNAMKARAVTIYRKSSKETRGSYSFSEHKNAGLIRILPNFCIFAYCFLSFLRVLLECGSYSRAGLFRGFTVCLTDFNMFLLSILYNLKSLTNH